MMAATRVLARRRWLVALVVVALAASGSSGFGQRAQAQDGTNLLSNGALERPYYGQGAPTRTAPQGWSLWVGAGAPEAFPHPDATQVLDGEVSWNVKQGFNVFTAAGYQQVRGLTAGEAVRATGYGWLYTCNNTETSCIIEEPPYRRSDPAAGASLRVGIDPRGGTDPNSPDVVWSASAAPYDQWGEMSAVAQAAGDTVTVFLYMTQQNGLALNNAYWDRISLVRTSDAPAAAGGEAAPPEFVAAPFVTPQNVRPNGSIVHLVQAGDTLSSIAYAYSQYGVTVESIAALNEGMRANTRFLMLGQEVMVLPPGAVDPVTGRLLQGAAAAPAQPADTAQTGQAAQPGRSTPIPTPTSAGGGPAAPLASPTPAAQTEGQMPPTYAVVRAASMPFERGLMLWIEDTNQIYVLINGQDDAEGAYSVYLDTWREGMPETDPSLVAPQGLIQPARGFGQAWRTYPGVQDALGWGTAEDLRYTALAVRDNGNVVVNGPDGRVYRLLIGGTWEAVDYVADDADELDAGAAPLAPDAASPVETLTPAPEGETVG